MKEEKEGGKKSPKETLLKRSLQEPKKRREMFRNVKKSKKKTHTKKLKENNKLFILNEKTTNI